MVGDAAIVGSISHTSKHLYNFNQFYKVHILTCNPSDPYIFKAHSPFFRCMACSIPTFLKDNTFAIPQGCCYNPFRFRLCLLRMISPGREKDTGPKTSMVGFKMTLPETTGFDQYIPTQYLILTSVGYGTG